MNGEIQTLIEQLRQGKSAMDLLGEESELCRSSIVAANPSRMKTAEVERLFKLVGNMLGLVAHAAGEISKAVDLSIAKLEAGAGKARDDEDDRKW